MITNRASSIKNWIKEHRSDFLVLLLYTLFAIAVTYPVIFNMRSAIYGFPGDSTDKIYYIWWQKYAILHGLKTGFLPYIAAPFGVNLSSQVQFAGMNYPMLLLAFIVDEVFAYNFLVIASFPIASFTMYLLVYHFTKNRWASFISGLIYGFAPYHFAHAIGHLALTMCTQWLPLFVLCMVRLFEKRTVTRMVVLGLIFALVCVTDYYNGYFMGVLAVVFALFVFFNTLIKDRSTLKDALIFIGKLAGGLVVGGIFVLPFVMNIFQKSSASPGFYAHPFNDLMIYSARPWDYFLPSTDNPVFGPLVRGFVRSHLHGSNEAEQTLYLGATAMLLAFVGLLTAVRRRIPGCDKDKVKYFAYFFAVAAVAMIVFSAPPIIPFGPLRIPMLSWFVYKVAPMFRVYARFGLVTMLCVAVLAGFGVEYLRNRWRDRRVLCAAAFIAISVLIAVEFTTFPPSKVFKFPPTPKEYVWLKSQPADTIVAEYPLVASVYPFHYDYLFYQRIHQKYLVNGAVKETKAEGFRQVAENLSDKDTPSVLRLLGAKYIIVHWDKYAPKKPVIPKGFKLLYNFNKTSSVYAITAPPASLVALSISGFDEPEIQKDGTTRRWMGEKGLIIVKNITGRTKEITLSFIVSSLVEPCTLLIHQDKRLIVEKKITKGEKKVIIPGIILKPGETNIVLSTRQGAQSIDSVLDNGDPRAVSIYVSAVSVAASP